MLRSPLVFLILLVNGCSERLESVDPGNTAPVAVTASRPVADFLEGQVLGANDIAEAGVWVIAETDELPALYRKNVVTGDAGRYQIPVGIYSSYSPRLVVPAQQALFSGLKE